MALTALLLLWTLSAVPGRAQVPEVGPTEAIRPRTMLRPESLIGIDDPEELARARSRFQELSRRTSEEQARAPRAKLQARAEDGVDVGQQGAAVTRSGQGRERYLQSHGAAPCVIVTLYDPETRTGALSHFDAGTGVAASLELMLGSMDLPEGTRLQARLIGGLEGISDPLFLQLINELDKRGVDILEADIKARGERSPPRRITMTGPDGTTRELTLPGGVPADSVILDAETGEVYDMMGLPPERFRAPPPDLTRPSGHVVVMMERGLLAGR